MNLVPGLGIPAFARRPNLHLKRPKPDHGDLFAPSQGARDTGEHRVYGGHRPLLCLTGAPGHLVGQLFLIHSPDAPCCALRTAPRTGSYLLRLNRRPSLGPWNALDDGQAWGGERDWTPIPRLGGLAPS